MLLSCNFFTEDYTYDALSHWREDLVSSSTIHNNCLSRPCDATEICIPTSSNLTTWHTTSLGYMCQPFKSQCPVPMIDNAEVSYTGTDQNDKAYFIRCLDKFVLYPLDTNVSSTCWVRYVLYRK